MSLPFTTSFIFMETVAICAGDEATHSPWNGAARRGSGTRAPSPLRLTFEHYDFAALPASQARGNPLANHFTERAHWIVRAVHVAAGHRKVFVPQQVAYQECVGAGLPGVAADRVAKIVQPHIRKLGRDTDALPCILDCGFRERPTCAGGCR